jgi:WhiB family transcriptional regulator, redox-sensing transcriptional regulator
VSALSTANLYDDYEPRFHRADIDTHLGTHAGAAPRLTEVSELRSPETDWVDEPPCSNTDPEIFFPGRGELARAAEAKAICAGCDRRVRCLEFALSVPAADDWGVWGGTTEDERKRIRKARARGLAA